MSMADSNDGALLAAPSRSEDPKIAQIVEVARTYGVSPFRQLREMLALRFSRARLDFADYYSSGAFDPAIPMARKKDFVGETSSRRLNDRLSPPKLALSSNFVSDKVLYTALVRQMGFRTTLTQAVVHQYRGFGKIPALRDAAEVREFLLNEARYPLFGKPCEGFGSLGSVLVVDIDREARMLALGNGRTVPLDSFCAEVAGEYPEGFIFQDALRQDPRIEDMIGRSVGTIRVVTLRDTETPRVLYCLWKLPSPTAMSDNFWQKGSMIAALDLATGCIQHVRKGTGLNAETLDHHPVSGLPFKDFQIPHWNALHELTVGAHSLLPEFGVIGWDIGITPDGPAIIEANPNPLHSMWQVANGRGIDNPDFALAFERTATLSRKMLKDTVSLHNRRWLVNKSKG